jgi:small subunit ribosomal protein S7
MSRRREAQKRERMPDPVYGSKVLSQFVNCVMRHGKKSIAEKIVYGALAILAERKNIKLADGDSAETVASNGSSGLHPVVSLFEEALDKIRPTVEVRSRRVGGATYQIPVEVAVNRRTTLAMRWLIKSASGRSAKSMPLRLADELSDALEGRGGAVKKREESHRMARANQAFSHFRW